MMRRSLFLLMICAAGAAMAQNAGQTASATVQQQEPVAPAVAPSTPVSPVAPVAPEVVAPVVPPVPPVPPAAVAPVEPVLEPLVKTDTLVGKGAEATVGSKVFVHYTGWLYKPMAPRQRGRQFDSSISRGEPLEFVLGAGRVIKGWDQGIKGMRVGGKRTLIIPSHLAYGSRGAGTMIGPGADLIFDVQLVDVK